MSSGSEVVFEHVTGTPAVNASSTGKPKPSNSDGKTKHRADAYRRASAGGVDMAAELDEIGDAALFRMLPRATVSLVRLARAHDAHGACRRSFNAATASMRRRWFLWAHVWAGNNAKGASSSGASLDRRQRGRPRSHDRDARGVDAIRVDHVGAHELRGDDDVGRSLAARSVHGVSARELARAEQVGEVKVLQVPGLVEVR